MELNLKVFLDAKLIDSGINLKNRPFFIFHPIWYFNGHVWLFYA